MGGKHSERWGRSHVYGTKQTTELEAARQQIAARTSRQSEITGGCSAHKQLVTSDSPEQFQGLARHRQEDRDPNEGRKGRKDQWKGRGGGKGGAYTNGRKGMRGPPKHLSERVASKPKVRVTTNAKGGKKKNIHRRRVCSCIQQESVRLYRGPLVIQFPPDKK